MGPTDLVDFSFVKQPAEKFWIRIRFGDRMDSDETLLGASIAYVVKDSAGGTVTTTDVIDTGLSTVSSTDILPFVKAGTAGCDYQISISITTSKGQILEEDVMMYVREKSFRKSP